MAKFQIVEAKCQYVDGELWPKALVMRDEKGNLYGFHDWQGDLTIVGKEKILAEFESEL